VRALALLLLLSVTAGAQEPADGPKRIFRDPFIEQLVGEWAVKAEWVLNHQFLQLHTKDVALPAAYEALVYIGAHWQGWTFTMESAGKDGKRQLFAVVTLRRK
jgi:hypothetical protein